MTRKLDEARNYVLEHIGTEATTGRIRTADTINDAANIFADDYNEYLQIWEALKEMQQ